MTEPSDILAPGKLLTSKRLRDALDAARGEVIGGPGIKVNSVGGKTVVSLKGQRIISRARFEVLLLDVPAPVAFDPNRWDYAWAEAILDVDNEWIEKPQGRRWDDAGRREARNRIEVGNTALIVQHGILLDQTSGTPGFTLTIEPLPSDTEVELSERRDENGARAYWFSAYNELKATCGGPSPTLPPPPTIDARMLS